MGTLRLKGGGRDVGRSGVKIPLPFTSSKTLGTENLRQSPANPEFHPSFPDIPQIICKILQTFEFSRQFSNYLWFSQGADLFWPEKSFWLEQIFWPKNFFWKKNWPEKKIDPIFFDSKQKAGKKGGLKQKSEVSPSLPRFPEIPRETFGFSSGKWGGIKNGMGKEWKG